MCSLSHLELATNVVESSFGPTVAKVASRLLSHGNQTMAELGAALPNLPLPQMRNILLVLIQQNIVSSGVRARGRGGASVTEYDAELDEILVRQWFPKILMHTREMFGAESDEELLMQELLIGGRLSKFDLFDRGEAAYAAKRGIAVESDEATNKRIALMQAAMVLNEKGYLVEVDTLPDVSSDDVAAAAARSPPKQKKGSSSAAAGGSGRKRKSSERSAADGGGAPSGPPLGGSGHTQMGAAEFAPEDDETKLFRVNLPRILMIFKHEAIGSVISDKLDSNAAGIARICLLIQESQAEPFTIEDVFQRYQPPPGMNRQLVLNYLDVMCSDPLCRIMSKLNDKYVLEKAELSNAVKQLLLEGVVRRKVGEIGCRLYRILLRKHSDGVCTARGQQKFDLKMVAETALLPEREARPLLWSLLRAGYVSLQEAPRASDHNPKTTTYLWFVSLPHVYRTLEQEMTTTLNHMHARLKVEQKAAQHLAANGDTMEVSERERQNAMAARAKAEAIELGILRLVDTVMLLRNL